jgi:hypothetical protein
MLHDHYTFSIQNREIDDPLHTRRLYNTQDGER